MRHLNLFDEIAESDINLTDAAQILFGLIAIYTWLLPIITIAITVDLYIDVYFKLCTYKYLRMLISPKI